jgi:phage-related protein
MKGVRMAAQAGSAFIAVRPDLRGFHTQVRRELRTVTPVMRGIGREWGRSIQAGIKEKLRPIEVRLDADRVARQIAILNRNLDRIDGRRVDVEINVDVGGALAELALLDRVLDRIDRRRVNVDVDVDRGVAGLRQMSGAATAATGGLRGMSAASSALSASLALAAGPQIAAVGAGIIGLIGPLTAAAAGFGGLAAVAIPSITRIAEGNEKLTRSEQQLKKGLDSTKRAFTEWQRALQPQVLPVFTRALGVVPPLLRALTPITVAAARAVGGLVDRLREGLQSPFFRQFAADIARWTGPAITSLGTLVGNLVKGLAGLARAFAPIGFAFMDMLNRATAAFARFTTGLADSAGFQRFAQAMISVLDSMHGQLWRTLMPLLQTLLTTLFRVGLALQQAFAPIARAGVPLLTMLAGALGRVAQAAAPVVITIGQVIGSLAQGLAPVIGNLLNVIGGTLSRVLGALGVALRQAAPSLRSIVVSIGSLLPELAPLVRLWGQWLMTIIPLIPAVLRIVAVIVQYLLPAVRFVIRLLVQLWTTVGGFILPVLAKMVSAVQWVAAVIQPAFQGIGALAIWLWNNAIGPALRGIGAAALWLWNNAIKPAFTFIGTLARWLYSVIVVAVIGPILVQFKIWAAVAKWLYGSVISPVFRGIGTVIRWAYNTLIRPVFNAFTTVIRGVVAPVVRWVYNSVIRPTWSAVGSTIRSVWQGFIRPTFNAVRDTVQRLAPHFRNAVNAIGRAWDKLKSAARRPVQYVVDVVYNKGIVRIWNAVARLVPGVSQLGGIRFARGGVVPAGAYGVLPGYAPGKDTMLAAVSPGEAWIRPDATRALGSGFIYGLNEAAAKGGTAGAARWLAENGFPRFGLGGIVGKFLGAAKNLFTDGLVTTARRTLNPLVGLAQKSIGGTPFGDLAVGVARGMAANVLKAFVPLESKIGGDGRKVVKVAEKYVGLSGNPNRFTREWGLNGYPWCGMFVGSVFREAGAKKALRRVAWPPLVSSYTTLPKVSRSAARPGDVALYRGDSGHINIYTGKGAVTIGGNESNSVRRQSGYINSASSIRRPQFARGGIVGRMLPALLGQDLRENSRRTTPVATQLLRAVAGQPMLYDQGGWLPPGITTVLNATGRPEAVLTEAQLRAIAAGARGGDGSSVTYNVYPRTLDMTVRDLEALQRRQDAMARVGRPR